MALSPPSPPRHAADDTALLYAPCERDGAFFPPWQPFGKSFLDVLRWSLTPSASDKSRPPAPPAAGTAAAPSGAATLP